MGVEGSWIFAVKQGRDGQWEAAIRRGGSCKTCGLSPSSPSSSDAMVASESSSSLLGCANMRPGMNSLGRPTSLSGGHHAPPEPSRCAATRPSHDTRCMPEPHCKGNVSPSWNTCTRILPPARRSLLWWTLSISISSSSVSRNNPCATRPLGFKKRLDSQNLEENFRPSKSGRRAWGEGGPQRCSPSVEAQFLPLGALFLLQRHWRCACSAMVAGKRARPRVSGGAGPRQRRSCWLVQERPRRLLK